MTIHLWKCLIPSGKRRRESRLGAQKKPPDVGGFSTLYRLPCLGLPISQVGISSRGAERCRFAREFEFRPLREVLNVIFQIVRAGQSLAADAGLATAGRADRKQRGDAHGKAQPVGLHWGLHDRLHSVIPAASGHDNIVHGTIGITGTNCIGLVAGGTLSQMRKISRYRDPVGEASKIPAIRQQ